MEGPKEMLHALEARDPDRASKIMESHIRRFSYQVRENFLNMKKSP